MPYSVPPKKSLVERIKSRYPNASQSMIRQFVHVFNSVLEETGEEGRAFSAAWSAIGKRSKTKRKKKAEIISYLIKLANELDQNNLLEEANQIDFLLEQVLKS